MKEINGWVKLHRKIEDWCWFGDPNTFLVFIHLLLMANVQDKKWRSIIVKRGSFITSLSGLSERIGISVQQIRTSLDKLISTHEVTKSSTSTYTVISINNYDQYQKVTRSATNEQQTSNKPVTTTKEYKNIRSKEIESSKLEEIAVKYKVSIKSVNETYEELTLYCKSSGKTYKDYEATLMNWIRRKIGEGKLKQELSQEDELVLEAKKIGLTIK
jgi:hypothetical protein